MSTQVPAELEKAMREAANRHASDLFMIPGEPLTFRVGGEVVRGNGEVLSAEMVRGIAEAMVGRDRLARMATERGQIVVGCDCGDLRGRMGISMSRGQHTVVVGMLPGRIMTPAELCLPEEVVEAAMAPNGLIVFSGPVGSGKTTSAFAILEHINANRAMHLCTVEDPINYILRPKRAIVQQREVGVDVPDTASGMIAATAQDLDVLFVAELRTPAEVLACVTAAQMGHLVITQVHAATPEEALQRLIGSQAVEEQAGFRRNLANVLRCVEAQVLLPGAGGRGKVAAYGVLVLDGEVRRRIAEGQPLVAGKMPHGCRDLAEDIRRLMREGQVETGAGEAAIAALRERS